MIPHKKSLRSAASRLKHAQRGERRLSANQHGVEMIAELPLKSLLTADAVFMPKKGHQGRWLLLSFQKQKSARMMSPDLESTFQPSPDSDWGIIHQFGLLRCDQTLPSDAAAYSESQSRRLSSVIAVRSR